RLEQRTLGREARKQKLPDVEAPAIEPATADEERIAASAAGNPGRLEIDEEEAPRHTTSGKAAGAVTSLPREANCQRWRSNRDDGRERSCDRRRGSDADRPVAPARGEWAPGA